jgi:hypothetical protein
MCSPASFPLVIRLSKCALITKRVLDLGVEDRCEVEVGHSRHEQVPCAKRRGSARARWALQERADALPIDAREILFSVDRL